MYQVIKMYGDWEPWWFMEDWQEDITEEKTYSNWDEAVKAYQKEWYQMKARFPKYHSQKNWLATFWTEEEKRWCEKCDDDLQQYHSLLLLKDGAVLGPEKNAVEMEQRNDCSATSFCKLNL
ncbi:DUF1033 family protein [Streptococcus halichoeri]|uniref:DUF1033 family protein n=1 Tax=Streptococcus halichoeri TaxID=254785 RepID=UPI001357FF11|nr:DUF1033 family protein [Streptococcus halichoeri]